ncbi:MAG: DUF790 family protein [Myxococcota bacterium]
MLTGDLVRVRVVKKTLVPSFISTKTSRLVDRAEVLLNVMSTALEAGWNRGAIDERIRDLTGTDVDHKITKGMAKLLMDKGEFESRSPIDPQELRWQVFSESAQMGPLARHPDTNQPTADDVYARVAKDLNCTPEDVEQALYADLKDQQVLQSIKLPTPNGLLERYNVALVQALLLKANSIELTLTQPDPKYVRQLIRYLKFYQLMYRTEPTKDGLRIELDGPQSLLRLSTRYGMQMANFFPAILLQPGIWHMKAEILWGKKRKFKKDLSLDHTMGLTSHYKDTGTWTSRTETWFVERFEKLDSDWSLSPGEPIDQGNQSMVIPDFTFRKKGKVAHMEIVGFWRKKHLMERLQNLPDNVILAVSSKLKGEAGALSKTMESQVIRFAEVIPAAKVVQMVESIAR